MSELRKNPVSNQWVVVAVERAKRPNDFGPSSFLLPDNNLKFDEYFKESLAKQKTPGFYLAINQKKSSLGLNTEPYSSPPFFRYKKEILAIKNNNKDLRYVAAFRDYRQNSPKSLKNLRHNLIGLASYPPAAARRLEGALSYYQKNKTCVYCDIISHESNIKKRFILENKNFIAVTPFASRFPLEVWILPKKHSFDYSDISSGQLKDLTLLFGDILARMKGLLGDFSYSYMLHTGPLITGRKKEVMLSCHWYVEITPLLTQVAGFEWGTGFYINPTPPELAAEYLHKGNTKSVDKHNKANPVICPFCFGNEAMTPPETDADRPGEDKPDSPGWLTRTVPNKFPALRDSLKGQKQTVGLFEKRAGIGFHEVIIETPEHNKQFADLSKEEIIRVIKVYRRRFKVLLKDKRFQYILIFKNHGLAAGASLEHSHTQLICLPMVPQIVSDEVSFAQKYFLKNKSCMFCAEVKRGMRKKGRIIFENKDFLGICPDSSRVPFELTILPKFHSSDFYRINNRQIEELSAILKEVLSRQKRCLKDPPYNFFLHTSPINAKNNYQGFYHWHIELLPKLREITGFERETEIYLNSVSPKDAARRLRIS